MIGPWHFEMTKTEKRRPRKPAKSGPASRPTSRLSMIVIALGGTVLAVALAISVGPTLARSFGFAASAEPAAVAAVAAVIAAVLVWPAAWAVTTDRTRKSERATVALRRELAKAKRAVYDARRGEPEDLVNLRKLATADKDSRQASAEQVIRMFLETSPGAADRLRAAMEDGDAEATTQHAQRLRAASDDVGSVELPGILADVEALAHAGDIGGMHAAATEVGRAFDNLTLALKTLQARG